MIGKEEMDRKQIFSYECSPTTTCSSASSTISSPIELNQDQYLPDFDDYYYKRMECENEHECYSVDGEEIKGEEFFWKEYEASVSNFCLNSVITVPPCNNTPATWSAENCWDIFGVGTMIQSYILGKDKLESDNAQLTMDKYDLQNKLRVEMERVKYYQDQINYHRQQSRDLEFKLLEKIAADSQKLGLY